MPEATERDATETNRLPTSGPQPVYGFDDISDSFEPVYSTANALHVRVVASGGGTSTPSTEATLLEVRNGVLALGVNTDGIEGLLTAQARLVDTQPVSAASLPLPAGAATSAAQATTTTAINLQAKLTDTQPVSATTLPLPTGAATATNQTATNALLNGTGSVFRAAQATATNTATIAAAGTVSDEVNLAGRSLVRIIIPAGWTTADINIQTSTVSGGTFMDLFDEAGGLYVIKGGASRVIFIAPGPLIGVNFLRIRSTVAQTSSVALTLISQVL